MVPIIICAMENPEERELMEVFYLRSREYLLLQAQKYAPQPMDAEDLVHDALVRIIDHIAVFRNLEPRQQLVYASVTIRNLAYNLYAQLGKLDQKAFWEAMEPVEQPDEILEHRQREEKIRFVWSRLDLEERMLLEQKYILHWSDEMLARQLGIQPQSVRMRLTRAKRSVVRQMEENGFQPSQW